MMVKSGIQWLKVFGYILSNRGIQSYGSERVKELINRELVRTSASKDSYLATEQFIKILESKFRSNSLGNLKRFGPNSDGGYVGLDLLDSPNILSAGVGKNIDFEIFFAARGSKVHIYDPTVKTTPKQNPNIVHYKSALEGRPSGHFKKSMELDNAYLTMLDLLGHVDYLKLDIEGSEWNLLEQGYRVIPKFTQIFVEFHNCHRLLENEFRDRAKKVMNALFQSHVPISVHSNNWKEVCNFGMSFIPDTFEVTFLRKDQVNSIQRFLGSKYPQFANNPKLPPIPDTPFSITLS